MLGTLELDDEAQLDAFYKALYLDPFNAEANAEVARRAAGSIKPAVSLIRYHLQMALDNWPEKETETWLLRVVCVVAKEIPVLAYLGQEARRRARRLQAKLSARTTVRKVRKRQRRPSA